MIKELGETKKELATSHDSLAQHISSTTLPMLNRLHRAQASLSEVSKGWSNFFSTLRQTKKEKEERQRRMAMLEQARVATEEEYDRLHNALKNTKMEAAEINALIVATRHQQTVLVANMEKWLRSAP